VVRARFKQAETVRSSRIMMLITPEAWTGPMALPWTHLQNLAGDELTVWFEQPLRRRSVVPATALTPRYKHSEGSATCLYSMRFFASN
jgi:hypothetical protein